MEKKHVEKPRKWLSKKDAQAYLFISQRTIETWAIKGLIQAYKISRKVLFDQDELDAAILGNSRNYKSNIERKWIAKKAVQSYLNISLRTIENWVNKRLITKYILGGKVYFNEPELDAAVRCHKIRNNRRSISESIFK